MITIERARMQNAFDLAHTVGAYEDWPLLPAEIDPQVHLSRNDRRQPFFLVCEFDTCLVQLAGESVIEFRSNLVSAMRVVPGDFVYVPARVPHRIEPRPECLQLRFKARDAGLEGLIFTCDGCGTELQRHVWETSTSASQAAYVQACEDFDLHLAGRACGTCGATIGQTQPDRFRWRDVAAAIGSPNEGDRQDRELAAVLSDPDPDRPPLKTNVFWSVQFQNTQLAPLFPELGPGAIVPCSALFHGEPTPWLGKFYHQNSVDEVVLILGSHNAQARGMVMVTGRQHPVENHLPDPYDPSQFVVSTITQRQSVGEAQRESILMRCENCNHLLLRKNMEQMAPGPSEVVPGLPTLSFSAEAAWEFNASEETRTCGKCGTVNPPFDLEHLGWHYFTHRHQVARKAEEFLRETGDQLFDASDRA